MTAHTWRTVLLAAVMTATAAPLSASTIFFEDFSNPHRLWFPGPSWAIGPAVGSPPSLPAYFAAGDPAMDATPTSDNALAGVNIGRDYSTSNPHDYYWLESPGFTTVSGPDGIFEAVTLEFRRWLNSDYPFFITNKIQVSVGTEWKDLWVQPNNATLIADSQWTLVELDLTPYRSTFTQLRWGYDQGTLGVYAAGGWNIDDVLVTGTPVAVNEPPSLASTAAAALLVLTAPLARRRPLPLLR